MATETVAFTGFASGEYGTLSPFSVGFQLFRGHMLYKGYWTGQNIMRGLDGTLFPRAFEKAYTLTGVPNGALTGMGYANANANSHIWFAVGTDVYRFRSDVMASQAVVHYTGDSLGAFTEPLAWVDHDGSSYVFAYPNGLFKLDHGAATVTAIAAGPDAYNCCVYGDRLMAGAGNTVYYSAPGDFETWPADASFQVGDVYNVVSLNTLRGRLAIGKAGTLGEPWYMLSGVPGFNDVLRQVEVSLCATYAAGAVDMGQGIGLVTDNEGTLAVFDGSHLHPLSHLKVKNLASSGIPPKMTTFRLRRPGEWGVVTDHAVDNYDSTNGSIWVYRNGAWTRHQRKLPTGVVSGAWSVSTLGQNRVVFGQGGDGSTKATFCSFDPYLDRPPFTSDFAVAIPDPADCLFTLPEWWARDGSEVAVKSLQVDFLSWNTGDTNPNTFAPYVFAMRTYDPTADRSNGGGGDVATGPQRTYSEATAGLSTSGSRRRMTFSYNGKWGNAFRLEFTNMRGVSIEKIVAVVETRPAQS